MSEKLLIDGMLRAIGIAVLAHGKAQSRDDIDMFLLGMFTMAAKEVLLDVYGSEEGVERFLRSLPKEE